MSEWFVPLGEARGDAGARLVVFPHAGGGPASVAGLRELLPSHIELWSVNLPGRQARLHEPPRTDLAGLVDDLATALAANDGPAPALFGYCSGALTAYLVSRRLHQLARPPARLLVGSAAAPDVANPPRRLHLLPAELLWDRLVDFGGVPAELAANTDLRPVLEPALRADFGLQAGYRHTPAAPLPTPITVLHGKHDRSLSRGGLLGWRRQSTTRPVLRELDASHWLVEDAPAELTAAIVDELERGAP